MPAGNSFQSEGEGDERRSRQQQRSLAAAGRGLAKNVRPTARNLIPYLVKSRGRIFYPVHLPFVHESVIEDN